MSAYVISEVEILDESQGQRYRERAAASIARPCGRYIVGGAQPEVPERDWPAAQRIVVKFPTMDRLRSWYASSDYAEALAVRETALTRRLLFVPGVEKADPSHPGCAENRLAVIARAPSLRPAARQRDPAPVDWLGPESAPHRPGRSCELVTMEIR